MALFRNWLPPPLDFSGCHDEQEEIEVAYQSFIIDFITNTVTYENKPVRINTHVRNGKEESFHHLITEDNLGFREYRSNRASKIVWLRPILEHVQDQSISKWIDSQRGGRRRLQIWLEPDYVVVLEECVDCWELITAYPTDRPPSQRDLSRRRARAR